MDQQNLNLTICQDCKEKPATYGDGLTWSRCSACQLKFTQENYDEDGQRNPPKQREGGFEHPTIPGKTSIIIPVYMNNYTLFHYTGNCIGSVREHTDKEKTPYELIIIDNGSPIKVPTPEAFYADKIVTHSENLGVTKAWNKGIRVSFGEYIVLLNNDTQVFEGWLEELKRVIDEDGYDLVMAHPMYSLTEPFARAVESKKVLEGKSVFDSLEKDFSCVMFKKDLYNQIGAFDEQFFAYASDVDYFKRMDQLGKKYKMVDKVAIHHISDATGYSIPETPQIMDKDKKTFEEKWKGGGVKMDEGLEEKEGLEKVEAPSARRICSVCFEDNPTDEHLENHKSNIDLVRTNETGDKIYLKKDERVHWIKDPETLEALEGKFGDEVTLTKEEFDKFERGEPIDSHNVVEYK